MDTVLISVLMTAYNREKYIGVAIESVLASTYRNFELIITDDVSKDNTAEIARSYADRDSRVRVYVNDKNLGDYGNRNRAASYAMGKYIKYLDADDYMYPHGLESMLYYFEKFSNKNIALGVFSLTQDQKQPFPIILSPKEIYQKHFFDDGVLATAPCSTIINRELFLKEGGFSGKRMVGDLEMWLLLGAKYDTLLMPGQYCWYRVHGEQEINTYNNYRGDYFKVLDSAIFSPDSPLNEEEKKLYSKKVRKGFSRAMLSILIKQGKINSFRLNMKSTGYNFFKILIEYLK